MPHTGALATIKYRVMSYIKEYWKLYIPTLLSTGLVLFAYLHILLIDDANTYRESILMPIEFVLLIASFISLGIILFALVVFLIKKNWKRSLHSIVSSIVTFTLIQVGMFVDSPTLIYIT